MLKASVYYTVIQQPSQSLPATEPSDQYTCMSARLLSPGPQLAISLIKSFNLYYCGFQITVRVGAELSSAIYNGSHGEHLACRQMPGLGVVSVPTTGFAEEGAERPRPLIGLGPSRARISRSG